MRKSEYCVKLGVKCAKRERYGWHSTMALLALMTLLLFLSGCNEKPATDVSPLPRPDSSPVNPCAEKCGPPQDEISAQSTLPPVEGATGYWGLHGTNWSAITGTITITSQLRRDGEVADWTVMAFPVVIEPQQLDSVSEPIKLGLDSLWGGHFNVEVWSKASFDGVDRAGARYTYDPSWYDTGFELVTPGEDGFYLIDSIEPYTMYFPMFPYNH